MPNFLSLVQRPHHSVRVKPQSRECHGLKRWIEAARLRLHRNVLAIACGRAGTLDEVPAGCRHLAGVPREPPSKRQNPDSSVTKIDGIISKLT